MIAPTVNKMLALQQRLQLDSLFCRVPDWGGKNLDKAASRGIFLHMRATAADLAGIQFRQACGGAFRTFIQNAPDLPTK